MNDTIEIREASVYTVEVGNEAGPRGPVGPTGTSGHTIQAEGLDQPNQLKLNFFGSGVFVTDNPDESRIDIEITGGTTGTHPDLAAHDSLGLATQSELNTVITDYQAADSSHANDTTNIHGISDTSQLALISDSRFTNQRVPVDGSVTPAKLSFDPATQTELNTAISDYQASIAGVSSDLNTRALDSDVVHDTGNESIAGIKTFLSSPIVPAGSFGSAVISDFTEAAQDAAGSLFADSATLDVTYNDAGNAETASVLNSPKINGIVVTGTPSVDDVLTATSSSAANWQPPTGGDSLSGVTVLDESTEVLPSALTLDFQGAGVTVTDGGSNIAVVAIPGVGDPSLGGDLTGTLSNAQIASGSIVNADISGSASIAKSKLAPLGIVNADVDAAAAIAKSKLAPLAITNADIDAAAAIAKSKLASLAIVNADVASGAAIARSKLDFGSGLVNADVASAAAIARSKLDFGSGLVNADIDAAAAIAKSKLASLAIVNADVASGAAIALSKLATDPLARANHTGTQPLSSISDFIFVKKTSDQNLTVSSTANQDVTDLFIPLAINSFYTVEGIVYTDGPIAADIKIAFTIPTGANLHFTAFGPAVAATSQPGTSNLGTTTTADDALPFGLIGTGGGSGVRVGLKITVTIETVGNTGNLQLRAAQNTSNATAVVIYSRSWLNAIKRS